MPHVLTGPTWQKPPLGRQLDRTHPLSQGLGGLWLCNENTGNQVFNLVDSSYALATSALTWKAMSRGSYASLVGGQLVLPSPAPFQVPAGASFTVISWVVPTAAGTPFGFSCRAATPIVSLFYQGSGAITFRTRNNANSLNDLAASPLGAIALNGSLAIMIAGVWANGAKSLYVNGLLVATFASSGPITGMTSAGLMSESIDGNMTGGLLATWYYNRALVASDIASIYAAPYSMLLPAQSLAFLLPGMQRAVGLSVAGAASSTVGTAARARETMSVAAAGTPTLTVKGRGGTGLALSVSAAGSVSVNGHALARPPVTVSGTGAVSVVARIRGRSGITVAGVFVVTLNTIPHGLVVPVPVPRTIGVAMAVTGTIGVAMAVTGTTAIALVVE